MKRLLGLFRKYRRIVRLVGFLSALLPSLSSLLVGGFRFLAARKSVSVDSPEEVADMHLTVGSVFSYVPPVLRIIMLVFLCLGVVVLLAVLITAGREEKEESEEGRVDDYG